MDVNFLTRIYVCHHGLAFSKSEIYLVLFQVYIRLMAFFESSQFFFYTIYLFGISFMVFLLPYFTPKLSCFLCIRLLYYPCAFSTYLKVGSSFVILDGPVLFIFLHSVLVSFKSLFFRQYLLIYLFNFYRQICLLFCFSQLIPTYLFVFFFLIAFACYRTFFTCPSNLISHPGFASLFGLYW